MAGAPALASTCAFWHDLPESLQHAIVARAAKAPKAAPALRRTSRLVRRLLPPARPPPKTAADVCAAVAPGIVEVDASLSQRDRAFVLGFPALPELYGAIAFSVRENGAPYRWRDAAPAPAWWLPQHPLDTCLRLFATHPTFGGAWVAAEYRPLLNQLTLALGDHDRWCDAAHAAADVTDVPKLIRCLLACVLHLAQHALDVPHAELLACQAVVQLPAAYDRETRRRVVAAAAATNGGVDPPVVFVRSVAELLEI
jgi:hypothetical protein